MTFKQIRKLMEVNGDIFFLNSEFFAYLVKKYIFTNVHPTPYTMYVI